MKEVVGDVWEYKADVVCIPTNGTTKKNGLAVMGAGVAQQAAELYSVLPKKVGELLKEKGNHVNRIGLTRMATFPVKHHWSEWADLELIRRSAQELRLMALRRPGLVFVLPRPGCGNGNRDWETEVKSLIAPILPDNVHVIDIGKGGPERWH